MNAERELHGWRWWSGPAMKRELPESHPKPKSRRVRPHADWILELALMLVLALLLPRCRRARK